VRWRYDEFEASFLYFVQELDLQSLLLQNDKQSQIAVSIQALQGRLAISNSRLGRCPRRKGRL
jgi:hypothetical protein